MPTLALWWRPKQSRLTTQKWLALVQCLRCINRLFFFFKKKREETYKTREPRKWCIRFLSRWRSQSSHLVSSGIIAIMLTQPHGYSVFRVMVITTGWLISLAKTLPSTSEEIRKGLKAPLLLFDLGLSQLIVTHHAGERDTNACHPSNRGHR